MDWTAFFTLHRDLPREGPGLPEDVAWALSWAGLPEAPRLCDLGCGPGADTAAILQAVPGAEVLAIDTHGPFIEGLRARFDDDPRVTAEVGDMADLPDHPAGPFDAIWSAGALYFLGLDKGPARMARALVPGGVLAFSEPAYFCDAPSDGARAFWDGYPTRSEAEVRATVAASGFAILAQRRLSDAAWRAYFDPIDARIAALRPVADPALTQVLDEAEAERDAWRAHRHETGYTMIVGRKS